MRPLLPLLLILSLEGYGQLHFAYTSSGMQGDTADVTLIRSTIINIDTLSGVVYIKEGNSPPIAYKILHYRHTPEKDVVDFYILQDYMTAKTLHMLTNKKRGYASFIRGKHITEYFNYSPHETSRLKARGTRSNN